MFLKYLPFLWRFILTYGSPKKFNYLAEFPFYKDVKPGTVVQTIVGYEFPITTKYVATSTGWLMFESDKEQVETDPKYLELQKKEAKELKKQMNLSDNINDFNNY